MPLKELIAKLSKQLQEIRTRQQAALVAAEADGVSAEDRTKHLAEFDKAKADGANVKASLDRAKELLAEQDAAEAEASQPTTQPIVSRPSTVNAATGGRLVIPAQARRHGPLKAFRGEAAHQRAYEAGLWIAATQYGHSGSRSLYESHFGPVQATQSTVNNGSAAYFVPTQIETAIIELAEEFGIFRRLADRVAMTTDTWVGPRWTGSLTAYFVAEGSAPPNASDPTWDQVGLDAKNMAAYGKMTRNLSEDAIIDLADKWIMALAVAFAEKEDDCGFNGDGGSTYGGITGLLTKLAATAALVTATGHTTLGALTLADFWSVVGALPNYPGITPAWLCHKEVYAASMGPLQTAAGGVTPQDIANGGIPRFLGYPVVFANKMPRAASVTTGTTGIAFGDLAMAAKFGDRRGRTVESGMINDDMIRQLLTVFGSQRFGINVHTIVDPRDNTKPGPIVGLKLA